MLSYINHSPTIYWDNYYKTGRKYNISPLQVLFENNSFKWSYYIALIAVLLYILFEGKRKQRSIKIIPQLTNKTFEYTQTIAGLYLDKKDHTAIAHKQCLQFYDFVREQLRIPTDTINTRFIEQLANRSGTPIDQCKDMIQTIQKITSQKSVTAAALKELYTKINDFKENTYGKSRK